MIRDQHASSTQAGSLLKYILSNETEPLYILVTENEKVGVDHKRGQIEITGAV